MGVVIVEDNICLKDVAKLIVWAVIGGIPWITIFDKNGKRLSDIVASSVPF